MPTYLFLCLLFLTGLVALTVHALNKDDAMRRLHLCYLYLLVGLIGFRLLWWVTTFYQDPKSYGIINHRMVSGLANLMAGHGSMVVFATFPLILLVTLLRWLLQKPRISKA